MAGCNKEADVKTADGPLAEVSFTVDFAGLQTKAWADGNTVDELLAGVYNAETGEYYDKVSTSATGILPVAVTGGKATFKATLVKGQSYNIVFWAQKSGTGYYDVDFAAKKLTVDYKGVANDEARDAFYTVYPTGTITGTVEETVTLKRPFAQINVLTTDEDVAAAAKLNVAFSKSAMKIAKVNDTMDLLTGETSGEVDVEYTANVNTEATILQGYTYVAMNYILAAADKANKDLSFDVELTGTSTVDNTVEVPNVPVRRNWRTNIVGNVFTADAVYTVVVDPIFDGTETLPLDGEVEETVLTFAAELDDEISVEVGQTVDFAATASSDAVVKYATSDETVGTITDEGLFTAVAEGTATVTVSADAVPATKAADPSKNYTSVEKTFSVTVAPKAEEPETEDYVKVTSTADITAGEYLIVYEEGSLAFNGGLEKLDAVANTIEVTIADGKIAASETVDAATFTLAAVEGGWSIQSKSGLFIGQASNANGLQAKEEALVNTIAVSDAGADVVSGGAYLRYNAASNQTRFRYYKSSSYSAQQPVALYKKAGSSDEPVEKTEVILTADDIQIEVGQTAEVEYTVTPADAVVTVALAEGADKYIKLDGKTVEGIQPTGQDGAKVVLTVAETETLKGATLEVNVTVTETVSGNGSGTLEDPFNTAGAIDFIKAGSLDQDVYVKGVVSKIVSAFDEAHGTGIFWISDDGTFADDLEKDFEVYSVYFLENESWVEGNSQVKVGDEVVVYGKLTSFEKSGKTTYETSGKNAYLYSLNGATTEFVPVKIAANDIAGIDAAGVTDAVAAVTVKKEKGWTASTTVDGTVVTAASYADGKITYSVAANSGDAREGWIKLTFKMDGQADVSATIKVAQNKAGQVLSSYSLDSNAIKAAHTAAWSYTSGDKEITAADGSVWTAHNTYAAVNQVTIQMNKGKGAYVLTPVLPEGKKLTKVTFVTNTKGDGTGTVGDRPFDILSADGSETLISNTKDFASGLAISGDHTQVRIICNEANGGAVYITSFTVEFE